MGMRFSRCDAWGGTAYILKIPFAIGALSLVSSVLAIGFIKSKTRIKEDTVIGLVFTGFSFGLVLISKTPSTVDLTHILFGNVLGSLIRT